MDVGFFPYLHPVFTCQRSISWGRSAPPRREGCKVSSSIAPFVIGDQKGLEDTGKAEEKVRDERSLGERVL